MLTAEQKKARLGRTTSSNVAATLGKDHRTTQAQAKEKINGLDEFEGNKATERGSLVEPVLLEFPCRKRGWTMMPAPFRTKEDWAGDSADCLYYDGDRLVAVGEGKSANRWVAKTYGAEGGDEIPLTTLIQAHWHLIHWPEVDVCIVPVLVGDPFEFREYVVERNDKLEASLWERAKAWHKRYIIDDETPPLEAGDDELVRAWYPESTDTVLEYSREIGELAEAYDAARATIKEAEKAQKFAKVQLQSRLGDKSIVEGPGCRVTWRNNKPSSKIAWEDIALSLMSEYPENVRKGIIAKHTKERPGPRVLRVTLKG